MSLPSSHAASDSVSDSRLIQLKQWLTTISSPPTLPESLRPASSDASFRRYFRVDGANGASYVVMDAPPPQEAFEYDDDVTQAAVSEIQARADKILSTGKWVVVDGYAGKR